MSSLKNRTVSSSNEAHTLIAEIASLKNSGAIKITKGSLLSDPMIEVEFNVSATEEVWSLRGVLDVHGGLTLRKIS